ncbi:transcription initiation factor IIE subunit alpha [Colletotrichum acutatum]
MDDAKTLVRQAVRAFYSSEQTVVIDVLLHHEMRKLNEDELYVYLDYHQALYAIQYIIHELRRRILGTDKRESSSEIVRYYTCPKCLSSWPLIDVIDNADRDGGFLCKRCVTPSLLREEPLTTDLLPRFNQQFAPFIQILERLDISKIPRVVFEDLYALNYAEGDGTFKRQCS